MNRRNSAPPIAVGGRGPLLARCWDAIDCCWPAVGMLLIAVARCWDAIEVPLDAIEVPLDAVGGCGMLRASVEKTHESAKQRTTDCRLEGC